MPSGTQEKGSENVYWAGSQSRLMHVSQHELDSEQRRHLEGPSRRSEAAEMAGTARVCLGCRLSVGERCRWQGQVLEGSGVH